MFARFPFSLCITFALIIFIGQIDNFLGIKTPAADTAARKFLGYFQGGFTTNIQTLVLGLVVIVTMLFIQKKWAARFPASLLGIIFATLINFVLGTALIAIALLVTNGGFQFSGEFPTEPVLYIGGLVGVVFIFVQVVLVPKIGTLAMGVSLLVGQLISSLLLDLVAPISSREVTGYTLAEVLLGLVGATLLAQRR